MGAGPRGTLASLPDKELVLAFQAGEDEAFDHLYQRHRARVTGICRRMLGNLNDAEEAAQETFLRAFEALHRFNGRFQVGPWLARIATNVCVDHLRSRGRAHLVALPADGDELRIEEGPESLIARRDPRLRRAIRDIQPTHARALVMRALEGLSHREIGERMEMGPGQVKALLHRARRSLRRAWDKAQGLALAPVIGMRVAASRSSANAHRAGGELAGQAGDAAPVIGAKVAVAVVAATLTGMPATEPAYEPDPPPRVSSVREVPEKTRPRAPGHTARTARAPAGERSPAELRRAEEVSGNDRTEPRRTFAAAAPLSDPRAHRSARGSGEHALPVDTSEPPSAVNEALETTGDLLGS
jgi:RNA polymerase sigma-70 factor, ECF subfamily